MLRVFQNGFVLAVFFAGLVFMAVQVSVVLAAPYGEGAYQCSSYNEGCKQTTQTPKPTGFLSNSGQSIIIATVSLGTIVFATLALLHITNKPRKKDSAS